MGGTGLPDSRGGIPRVPGIRAAMPPIAEFHLPCFHGPARHARFANPRPFRALARHASGHHPRLSGAYFVHPVRPDASVAQALASVAFFTATIGV